MTKNLVIFLLLWHILVYMREVFSDSCLPSQLFFLMSRIDLLERGGLSGLSLPQLFFSFGLQVSSYSIAILVLYVFSEISVE